MSKYSSLTDFLRNQPQELSDITVSFTTLENQIGDKLPESAYTYPAWWGNEKNKNRSQEILYKFCHVLSSKENEFKQDGIDHRQ